MKIVIASGSRRSCPHSSLPNSSSPTHKVNLGVSKLVGWQTIDITYKDWASLQQRFAPHVGQLLVNLYINPKLIFMILAPSICLISMRQTLLIS